MINSQMSVSLSITKPPQQLVIIILHPSFLLWLLSFSACLESQNSDFEPKLARIESFFIEKSDFYWIYQRIIWINDLLLYWRLYKNLKVTIQDNPETKKQENIYLNVLRTIKPSLQNILNFMVLFLDLCQNYRSDG